MKVSAIIPVKTFSKAKTRLDLPQAKKEELCILMFEEILETLSTSHSIDQIVVVTKDDSAIKIAKKFSTIHLSDKKESGVNNAVSLADDYLTNHQYDASIVFPQDIPFLKIQDIDFLLRFVRPPKSTLIVPSRKFDGTNALLRMPTNLMKTHYDEDSYKIHLSEGKLNTKFTSLIFVRRIMLDIDSIDDLQFAISQNEKPVFCEKIIQLLNS